MKILWIVNNMLPVLAEHLGVSTSASGSWLVDMARRLGENSDCELAVACVFGKEFRRIELNNTVYYILPGNGKDMLFYNKGFEKLWRNIVADFKPDVIHIHGTEYSHGLACMRALPNEKYILSIQGILNRIKDVDFGGLSAAEIIFNRTMRENVRLNGMIEMHFLHKKNAKLEKEMLMRAQYANCVNHWDTSIVNEINPRVKVFRIEYNLRDAFYSAEKWNSAEIVPHRIFTNPGGTPLKGIHNLFKALALVKVKYPDVKLYIPGMGSVDGKLRITGGYTKYLGKLVKKLNLSDNIVFLGRQSGEEMMQLMKSSNVVVVPSAIEGTSLILREAMYLGCPCIASFRGGMADYISDKVDGYLYDYQEYPYLANRIMQIFEDKDLSVMSRKAIEKSEKAHDCNANYRDVVNMYREVCCTEETCQAQ